MKLTRTQLQEIIEEEIQKVLDEAKPPAGVTVTEVNCADEIEMKNTVRAMLGKLGVPRREWGRQLKKQMRNAIKQNSYPVTVNTASGVYSSRTTKTAWKCSSE